MLILTFPALLMTTWRFLMMCYSASAALSITGSLLLICWLISVRSHRHIQIVCTIYNIYSLRSTDDYWDTWLTALLRLMQHIIGKGPHIIGHYSISITACTTATWQRTIPYYANLKIIDSRAQCVIDALDA